jgi:hypothetical protein
MNEAPPTWAEMIWFLWPASVFLAMVFGHHLGRKRP